MKKIDQLLTYMKIDEQNAVIQKKQTAHRMRLVQAFEIKMGDHVLEIGSGQGDTTVVLADAVGESGKITAVDIASSDYGAPYTLKEATDVISASPLGKQIDFHFETDVLDSSFTGKFDVAVLSHSLFYFPNEEILLQLFTKLRKIANRICLADWDLEITSPSQVAHAQAILLQSLYAQYEKTDANIQMLVTKESMVRLLQEAGWTISGTETVDAKDLDDGKWEVAMSQDLKLPELSPLFKSSQKLIEQMTEFESTKSLNSFVLLAE